jgi:predicted glycosyltransferase
VHGDPALVPLEESWDLPAALREKIAYTGYISEASHLAAATESSGEIIVAAGGGSVGDWLFEAAAEAGDAHWRLLVGGHDKDERIARLDARGGSTIIEGTRPDFKSLLAKADLAVLQCGYNTALDVVQTGVRAVFVPFEGEGETEQITRARAFAERFGCGLVREHDLSPASLRAEIERVLALPKPDYSGIGSNGIDTTVALANAAYEARS